MKKNMKNSIALSVLFSSTQSLASFTEVEVYDPLAGHNKLFSMSDNHLDSVVPGMSQITQLCSYEQNFEYEIVVDENIVVLCSENGAYIDLSDFDDLIDSVPLELSSHQQNGVVEEEDRL